MKPVTVEQVAWPLHESQIFLAQVFPSPSKPLGQAHEKLPTKFVQMASGAQTSLSHSSISEQVSPLPVKPDLCKDDEKFYANNKLEY